MPPLVGTSTKAHVQSTPAIPRRRQDSGRWVVERSTRCCCGALSTTTNPHRVSRGPSGTKSPTSRCWSSGTILVGAGGVVGEEQPVDPAGGVPTGPVPAHLQQPRPHLLGRGGQRDGVRGHDLGVLDEAVTGQRVHPLVPRGAVGAAQVVQRQPARGAGHERGAFMAHLPLMHGRRPAARHVRAGAAASDAAWRSPRAPGGAGWTATTPGAGGRAWRGSG